MFKTILTACLFCLISTTSIQAQGLLWSLPEDGTWVRYEGEYQQIPEDTELKEVTWIRHLTIKSVGRETVDYQEKSVVARWIELKAITGKAGETGLDPGPVGTVIYKVLMPEETPLGRLEDDNGLPITTIPIVKGYYKIAEGQDPKPLKVKVLQVNPLLTWLRHYRRLSEDASGDQEISVPAGEVTARKYIANFRMEFRSFRTVEKATLWRSGEIPFGLAKWAVDVEFLLKGFTQPRSEFQRQAQVRVNMSAVETGTDAQSELVIAAEGAQ